MCAISGRLSVKLFKYDCYVFMTGCIRFRAQPPRPLVPATVRVPATATTSASSLAAAAPLAAAPSSSPPQGPSPSSSSPLTSSDCGSAVPRGGRVIPAALTSVLPAASHGPLPTVVVAVVPVLVLHLPLFLLVATGLLDI